MMDIVNKLIPVLVTFLSKEENMLFVIGFILGAVIGGLVATFVAPMFWKPKV